MRGQAPGQDRTGQETGIRMVEVSRLVALGAVLRSGVQTARLLLQRRMTMPRLLVGAELRFADGSRSTVFRETAVRDRRPADPVVLVVMFRLRGVRTSRWMHAVFRRTCIVNTPLFAGFPGFVTKLWLTDAGTGVYRGLYEWDGADAATSYAVRLRRVLALVSIRGSVEHRVAPGLTRDDVLSRPELMEGTSRPGGWQVAGTVTDPRPAVPHRPHSA